MKLTADRMRAMIDSLSVGLVALDAKGRVELQNDEASRILGVSEEASVGNKFTHALGVPQPAVAMVAEVLSSGREVGEHDCSFPPRLGTPELIVDMTAAPLLRGDDVDGAVLTLRDHTIGRELEALLDQRARSDLFAALAAGIAHEIRNPLGGIRGSAELLEKHLEDPKLRRYPELIRAETDRVRRLLDDLAELTRGGDLSPARVNLHRVIDDMLELTSNEDGWGGIEIHKEYDPSIPELDLDSDRVRQVFLNLVRNSVQAMAGQGRLTLRTRVETLYQIAPDSSGPRRLVRIEVEDSGPGIDDADLPHLFTPFFTRREGGTGLGLAIAQHWTVLHGGRIEMVHAPGGGNRALVYLPIRIAS